MTSTRSGSEQVFIREANHAFGRLRPLSVQDKVVEELLSGTSVEPERQLRKLRHEVCDQMVEAVEVLQQMKSFDERRLSCDRLTNASSP